MTLINAPSWKLVLPENKQEFDEYQNFVTGEYADIGKLFCAALQGIYGSTQHQSTKSTNDQSTNDSNSASSRSCSICSCDESKTEFRSTPILSTEFWLYSARKQLRVLNLLGFLQLAKIITSVDRVRNICAECNDKNERFTKQIIESQSVKKTKIEFPILYKHYYDLAEQYKQIIQSGDYRKAFAEWNEDVEICIMKTLENFINLIQNSDKEKTRSVTISSFIKQFKFW